MWHEKLTTALIVICLTGLIWYFADRANKDTKEIKVELLLQPAPNVVVLGQQPASLEFRVMVSAPRGVVSDVVNETQVRPLRCNFVLGENVGTGLQEFNSAAVLSQLAEIQQRGLAVDSDRVDPKTFTLDIDKMVRRPAIRIKPEFRDLVVETEEPNPSTCSVYLPQRLAEQLAGEVLPVDVSRYVDPTQSGVWQQRTVDLRWPADVPGSQYVRFDPSSFSLKFRLKDATGKRTFDVVQVYYYGMPDVLDRYRIERLDKSTWRPTITVSGPKQRVENMQKDDVMLFVKIVPDDENSVGKRIRRSVSVILPPGITMEGQPPEVDFKLVDRAESTVAGG